MPRSLHMGMDILSVAGLETAAAYARSEVPETDALSRAPLMAQESIESDAAVVGLEEATLWECREPPVRRVDPGYDFTADLIDALAGEGAGYQIALALESNEAVQAAGFASPAVTPLNGAPPRQRTARCGSVEPSAAASSAPIPADGSRLSSGRRLRGLTDRSPQPSQFRATHRQAGTRSRRPRIPHPSDERGLSPTDRRPRGSAAARRGPPRRRCRQH
jgi:hypothetical protein